MSALQIDRWAADVSKVTCPFPHNINKKKKTKPDYIFFFFFKCLQNVLMFCSFVSCSCCEMGMRWSWMLRHCSVFLSLSGSREWAESILGPGGRKSHAVSSPLFEKGSVHGEAQHGTHCGTYARSQPEGGVL